MLSILATLLLLAGPFPQPVTRAPVPDEATIQKAAATVKSAYGASQASAKTRTAKLELATKLLEDALETKDDPAAQLVMLRAAVTIATSQSDLALTMAACREMEERFQVSDTRLEPLREFVAKRAMGGVFDAAQDQAQVCLARDDYATAIEYAKLAESAARSDPAALKLAVAKRKALEAMRTEHAALAEHYARLKTDALDGPANLAVGKFICFRKQDWTQGLPYLAATKDPALSKLAEQELVGSTDPKTALAIGDGWWSYAASAEAGHQLACQQRAAQWYAKALPALQGIELLRTKARLVEVPPQRPPSFFQFAKSSDIAFQDWTGEQWAIDARRGLKVDRNKDLWRLRCAASDGHVHRMLFFQSIEPKQRKLVATFTVVDGWFALSLRPIDGTDRCIQEFRFEKGRKARLECFVRKGEFVTIIDGVESTSPINLPDDVLRYAFLTPRTFEIVFEELYFE